MMNLELKVGAGWCEFLRKVRAGIYRYLYRETLAETNCSTISVLSLFLLKKLKIFCGHVAAPNKSISVS